MLLDVPERIMTHLNLLSEALGRTPEELAIEALECQFPALEMDDEELDDFGSPDMNRDMTWADISFNIHCYGCNEHIVDPKGAAWVQQRPWEAVPYCQQCLTPSG